jgi:hypothetical protein
MSRVDDVLREYRTRLLERDHNLQQEYVRRWIGVEDRLRAQIDALALEIQKMRDANETVTTWKLLEMERYQSLLGQARREVERFDQYVAGEIAGEQYRAWADGIDYGVDSVKARWVSAKMEIKPFQVLDINRVKAIMGLAGDGSPLFSLLNKSYPETIAGLTQTLTNSIALGWNPRKTANLMAADMAGNLQRALLVSRSEQMRAHRLATVEQYRTSGVVVGYRRRASLSATTCLACLLEDGKLYQMQEQFSDHPAGRCTCTAELIDVETPQAASGKDYLLGLDASKQKELMGPERYRAWKEGAVSLDQMSQMHQHETWGESPRLVPVKEFANAE